MFIDVEEQYDKIYRYCYFKLHNRELAEDITQETFLRYLEHYDCVTQVGALKCLYTIARNLCIDEYRRTKTEFVDFDAECFLQSMESQTIVSLGIKRALSRLEEEEQELLLLRYVNEVPVAAVAKIYGISRFAVYRKVLAATTRFKEELRKEDLNE